MSLVAQLVESRTDVVNTLSLEWGSVALISIERCNFTQDTLNQMTNSHPRGNSMRIYNHIWYYPL